MRTYAVDTESYYSKTCSLKIQGVWNYLRHPDSDHYMVSVVGEDGYQWVGHPKDFDWSLIGGPGTRWVCHNAQYDLAVFHRYVELGYMPEEFLPEQIRCTADMAAYHGIPRSLKGAIETVFGSELSVSKEVRNAMVGQYWKDMTPDFQKEVSDYALHDSLCCLKLWQRLSPTWPEHEQLLSYDTIRMCLDGIPVNAAKIEESIQTLKDHMWEALNNIPWSDNHPPLSPKQLAEECRKVGIVPPKSLAQDSEECAEWEDKYGDKYPWINAMRTYRRCNALKKKFEAMQSRIKDNGRMDAGLLYCGAHTLRDSGSGGVNLQNMTRTPLFDTYMRECIEAPEGKTFVICDLSQIEPRVLTWLAGDTDTLKLLSSGMGPYEAHARATMNWTGGKLKDENPSMYALSKARCLALGFQAGWEKFIAMAKNYVSQKEFDSIFKIKPSPTNKRSFEDYLKKISIKRRDGKFAKYTELSEEEQWVWVNSWTQVNEYRKSNKYITDFWAKLGALAEASVGRDMELELPSNRSMIYRSISKTGDGLTVVRVVNGKWTRNKIYSGLLAENCTQSLARDVFMDRVLKVIQSGHKIVMRVHDEVVIECDEDKAEEVLAAVQDIMHTPPDWFPSLPIASSGEISKTYKK